ncbi:MAG: MFS transporter [Sulfurimicrobium sp.]|jgi:MFS family permease|nr:MFS transporter [Sulfurimicrobium sp.]
MSAINALSRLPPAVWLLGLVSLLNDSASELVYPLLALATSWPMVLTLRFADRVGKGLRPSPRDALLALSVVPEQRGLAFGVHRAMDNAGAVIGPLLAAWLLWQGFSAEAAFGFSAFCGVLAALLLKFWVAPGIVFLKRGHDEI